MLFRTLQYTTVGMSNTRGGAWYEQNFDVKLTEAASQERGGFELHMGNFQNQG